MDDKLKTLAEYSRQPISVGSTGHFLFDDRGQKLAPEALKLSLLARIANELEGNSGSLIAPIGILLDQADDFRDLVGFLDGRPTPLAIVGWQLVGDSSIVEASLSYVDGIALFMLGRQWQEALTEQSEGGQPNE